MFFLKVSLFEKVKKKQYFLDGFLCLLLERQTETAILGVECSHGIVQLSQLCAGLRIGYTGVVVT